MKSQNQKTTALNQLEASTEQTSVDWNVYVHTCCSGRHQEVVGSGRQQSSTQRDEDEGGTPPPPPPRPAPVIVHRLPPASLLTPPTSSLLTLLERLQLLLNTRRETNALLSTNLIQYHSTIWWVQRLNTFIYVHIYIYIKGVTDWPKLSHNLYLRIKKWDRRCCHIRSSGKIHMCWSAASRPPLT